MIYVLFILLFISRISFADIFSKPSDQSELNQALSKDWKNFYYRGSYDYNSYTLPESPAYRLKRGGISLGCNRYDFHESLKNFLTRSEFNSAELEILMNQLSTSRLLVWQYSSPTLADLYKHLDTMGHLRLNVRYQQCEDLERVVDDPVVKLRKQSVMDCLKHPKGTDDTDDIDGAFRACFDHLHSFSGVDQPYKDLEDPQDARYTMKNAPGGVFNVTEKTLNRIDSSGGTLAIIKDIIPTLSISDNSITITGPVKQSRQLIAQYRSEFLSKLRPIINGYKQHGSVNDQQMSDLSVFGVPLTEGQVRNIVMLDDTTGYLAMNKIASELAYLKTLDQYSKAVEMLGRVMSHPAIEPGYKTLLKSSYDFAKQEIISLKEEKERLSQYADTMHTVLEEADRQRLKTIAWMQQEAASQEQKGLFKINP